MRATFSALRVAALILVVGVSLTACKGQRAQTSLNKTQDTIGQLETLNASTHVGQRFEDLKSRVSQANQLLAGGDTNQAFNIAREVRTQADNLLIEVEAAESRNLWTIAEQDIAVAERNSMDRFDSPRYNRILDIRREANTARDDNDFRALIRLSREISQEVASGIAQVRNEAENARIQAESRLTELRAAGGSEYDPESVIDVQSTINAAIELMDRERDFVLARSQFRSAIARADQGIENVQREKGKEAIQEIEELIRVAKQEGAERLNIDEYETVFRQLESVVDDFNTEQYTRALERANDLRPRAETLKLNTKRLASDDRIRRMRNDIGQLVDGGAREYLPGRVEELDRLLAEAEEVRQRDTEAAFDRVRELYFNHEDEVAAIDREFSAIALDSIRLAANDLAAASRVFERMVEIFEPTEYEVPASMRSFEAAKGVRREQLGQEIDNARDQLEVARDRVGNRQYRQGILIAQDQSQAANNIISEVYATVAGNAIIELSALISRYERDGARIYAIDELERSAADLNRVKESLNAGRPLEAVELAGAARANAELMARRISGRAVEDIREARRVLEEVSSDRTRRFAAEMLDRVAELIDQAEDALQEERLKPAVELANEAIRHANDAQNLSNRRSAEEAIDEAAEKIERATASGAMLFAGRDVESARSLFASSEALLRAGDFVRSEEQALAAAERADAAFFMKVNQAESAIADAKAVGGWERNNRSLSRASADARSARAALEARNFEGSAELADSARSRAESVARSSRRANFNESVRRIRVNLDEGQRQGINYFQVGDSVEIRRRLAAIQNQWSIDNYDFLMNELARLEGNLRVTLDSTDEVVSVVAEQQGERLERFVERGAEEYAAGLIDRARNNLRFAVIDYRNGVFKRAHSQLASAITDINEIERRYRQENYVRDLERLFSDYQDAQFAFRNVLSLEPTELKALAFGNLASRGNMVSISGQSTPADFRRDVERLYSQAIRMDPPPALRNVHQGVINAFNDGRISAIHFEKLVILNETSTGEAERLIDAAYERINISNRQISDIQRQFFNEEIRVRLVSDRR